MNMRRYWISIAALAIIATALVTMAGCGSKKKHETPTGTPSATAATSTAPTAGPPVTASSGTPEESFEGGTRAPVEGTLGTQTTPPPLPALVDVRAAKHDTFDRIVFEFDGVSGTGYRVEYTPGAILCGSGQGVSVGGAAVLRVRFASAVAHNDAATPTANSVLLDSKLRELVRAEQTCDFEGEVTWHLGLTAESDFKVTTLENPPRLVVDIKHP